MINHNILAIIMYKVAYNQWHHRIRRLNCEFRLRCFGFNHQLYIKYKCKIKKCNNLANWSTYNSTIHYDKTNIKSIYNLVCDYCDCVNYC